MSERIVIDTNTLISAVLSRHSVPRQAVDSALAHGTVLVSEETTSELMTVLLRSKFDRYLSLDVRERFLTAFLQQTTLIVVDKPITVCRDPKDDKFLEVAVHGNATLIISGDQDLLDLHPYYTIDILTPRAFLDRI